MGLWERWIGRERLFGAQLESEVGRSSRCNQLMTPELTGVCTNATAPSVSSINRILRNRAAERAAAEFARAAGYGLYPPHPYPGFPWPAPTHMWPSGHGMPNITSPGSASTPRTLGSPNSGSHDTLGSPDGSRLIGEKIFLWASLTHAWVLIIW